ncbi:nucleotidyltransferase substrate binding protein [Desulfomarina sp.]
MSGASGDKKNDLKKIRWRQRFQNLEKGFRQLESGLAIADPSDIERQGIIQSFEFSFELAWKTMKDFLEAQGVHCRFPRDGIKNGFQYEIIDDGECWLEMLGKRNLLAHTYDETLAMGAYRLIKDEFSPEIRKLVHWLRNRVEYEQN